MTAPGFVTRFAPSPTGLLHRGHAFSALTAFDAACAAGGRFLLRIEDIDAARCRPEYEAAILEDLAWLGLSWESPVWKQSQRTAAYLEALERLRAMGVLYRCFRTRRELAELALSAPHDAAPPAPPRPSPREEAAALAEGRPFAWRLSLAAARDVLGGFEGLAFEETGAGPGGETGFIAARPEIGGDIVLARKDVGVSYHLAATLDDAAQRITCVIRGADLFPAAHTQRLIQALLGLPTPVYRHHRLILRPDGVRFAKRDAAETLRALREAGVTPAQLRRDLGLAPAPA